ncbi:unnamed protein product [Didymodactylos carnosus]|uniref:G-protein coupled receptors family 1 profile domain-containing protein n=1 Tax=Didymodactylos carnosus TaxID=1234261 RepID=A0A8S2D2J8_9BILA|nr:unnamed protein product [Didymodactylos carnosus]CAF3647098.1 unnamed protein product [Didymodactylos carnosus]
MEHHYTTTVRDAWGLCLLTFQNLMRIHRRIQPVTDGGERNASQIKVKQRDRQLISMLLAEVLVYILSTSFYPINIFYSTVTMNEPKNALRVSIESFLSFLANTPMIYFNNASPFYIYLLTSRTFRQEMKHLLINYCLKYCFKAKFANYSTAPSRTVGDHTTARTIDHQMSVVRHEIH